MNSEWSGDAAAWIEQVGRNHPGWTAGEIWQEALRTGRNARFNCQDWRALWQELSRRGGNGDGSGFQPVWYPDPDASQNSNLARWMRESGHADFQSFRRWSLEHREQFWVETLKRLGFPREAWSGTVLDLSRGGTEARWFPDSRWNIVDRCFQADPASTAIISARPGEPLVRTSLAELRQEVAQVVGALQSSGFQAGDAVGLVLPMTPRSVALYLGLVALGCRAVSIADSFAPPEIGSRLRIAGAKAVFTFDRQVRAGKSLPMYARVCEATSLPVIVLSENGGNLELPLRTNDLDWRAFVDEAVPVESWPEFPSDHILNVLFSSGTTGDPKAIPWTQLTPIKCAVDGMIHQDIRPGHVVCWPTSLGWMMGPWLVFATLMNRGTLALYEDVPMGEDFGRFVEQAGVNMLGVVPTLVRAWRESRCMEACDWSQIHVFSSTGESSRADDMFYLSSLAGMRPVIEYCGGTEIGGGYISQTVLQPAVPAAFSTPAAGLDFVILDPQGQPADEGELFLIPPAIGLSASLLNRDHAATYFADTPAVPSTGTASGVGPSSGTVLRRHGDHFRRLPGGYFAAGGRVDDTMNLGGIKTSSAEIERVLNLVPGVRETAAVAWAEQGGPDELHVFWVADPANQCPPQLMAAMNERLKTDLNPLFKVRAVHAVDSLPRTASNKVMRRLLRDRLRQP